MGSSLNTFIGGGLLDKVWVAPSGTAMPTSLTSAPIAAFKDVGYLSDDGIEYDPNVDRKEFKAHQGGTIIRRKVTGSGRTFKFVCLEHNLAVMDLVYPGTVWTDVSTYVKGVIPDGIATTTKAWIVDTYDTTNNYQQRWAFTGEASMSSAFKIGVEDLMGYEFTLAIYGAHDYYTNFAQMITDVV
jgi:hypothetical protein